MAGLRSLHMAQFWMEHCTLQVVTAQTALQLRGRCWRLRGEDVVASLYLSVWYWSYTL